MGVDRSDQAGKIQVVDGVKCNEHLCNGLFPTRNLTGSKGTMQTPPDSGIKRHDNNGRVKAPDHRWLP